MKPSQSDLNSVRVISRYVLRSIKATFGKLLINITLILTNVPYLCAHIIILLSNVN